MPKESRVLTYLDRLEIDVIKAADVLHKERYYEHIDCLYRIIEQAKHTQRLMESLLNHAHGARTYEESEAELDRATNEQDWYRHD